MPWFGGIAAESIFSAMRRLFRHDKVTHMASVELWVLMTTLLLVVRFILDFKAPFYVRRSRAATVQIIHMLNHAMVQYTMGLMQVSAARVNDYFQVWAVLLVTLQYSVKSGNPYGRSKQVPLLDLMSTFWAANLLRMQTVILLKVPLWLIWALNAARIISYFSLSEKAATINQESTRLVSDYMSYEHTLGHSDDAADPAKEFKMQWYKYLVLGEDVVLNEVQQQLKRTASAQQQRPTASTRYRVQLKENHKELITVEKIWNVDAGSSGLLGDTADAGNRLKDVCLSFALYKLLRRRFYNLPIHEAGQVKTRRLVFDYILQDNNFERAFRVTEVELSLLHDFFYSKHATMFANGFPVVSMLLSALLASATGYIAYPVRHIPERMDQDDRNRITHGVFVSRLIVALIITKELSEIFLYVFSQWAKVRMICMYAKPSFLRHTLVEAAMRLMFRFIVRGKWDQRIFQYNLLISSACSNTTWLHISSRIILRNKGPTSIKLESEVTKAIFESFKGLQQHPERLESYFSNAFGSKADLIQQLTWAIELEADTHRILVWHIATCLCEINLSDEAVELKVIWLQTRLLVNKSRAPEAVWAHYVTAASLSNYCAYLLTNALVPDNGLVVYKVLHEVRRETLCATRCSRSQSMQDVYDELMKIVQKTRGESDEVTTGETEEVPNGYEAADNSIVNEQVPNWEGAIDEEEPEGEDTIDEEELQEDDDINSIIQMGTKLAKQLIEAYAADRLGLWRDLAEFWTGFLLHLAASTRAAKHKTQLVRNKELITHLWALLTHAGFLGSTIHGQTLLDPEDLEDVDPLS